MLPHPPPPAPRSLAGELDQADDVESGAVSARKAHEAADAALTAELDAAADRVPVRGELVAVTYLDTSTGVDVVRYGLVLDVEGGAVRVAYLDAISDPIALAPPPADVDQRVDLARVDRLEV